MEKYDLIIVGAGPAGIFTAVELLRHGSKKKILLVLSLIHISEPTRH